MENQSIENDSMTHKNCCFSYRYKYFPILIILFGVLFLGRALEWWSYDAGDYYRIDENGQE